METFVYPPLPIPIGDVWQKVVVGAKKKEKIKHMNDIFHNFCLSPFANLRWGRLADGRGWCQINVNEELLAPTWIPQTPNVAPD